MPHLSVFPRISYHGNPWPKLNYVLISRLTVKCATQNIKKYAVLSYEHVVILWTYKGAKQ